MTALSGPCALFIPLSLGKHFYRLHARESILVEGSVSVVFWAERQEVRVGKRHRLPSHVGGKAGYTNKQATFGHPLAAHAADFALLTCYSFQNSSEATLAQL